MKTNLARNGVRMIRLLAPLVLALVAICLSAPASAQTRSLEHGPIVRRMLLYRSSKLEVAPLLGSSFSNIYRRDVYIGVSGRYHFTNSLALGLSASFTPVQLDTGLMRSLKENDPETAGEVDLAVYSLLSDFHISYVPVHGKFNLLGERVFHWDLHLNAGIGGSMVGGDSDDLSGLTFGPAIGGGVRVFIRDGVALNVSLTDYAFSSADAQRGSTEPIRRFQQHWIGFLGASFFLPPDVRISR